MNIKPIETVYNGYRFRSRLEARWAVFFDALGVEYEYEPEGFTLPSGEKYLPDFRVKCFGVRGGGIMRKNAFCACDGCKHRMEDVSECNGNSVFQFCSYFSPVKLSWNHEDFPDWITFDKPWRKNILDCKKREQAQLYFDLYIEVKGRMTERDARKIREFSRHESVLVVGDIPDCENYNAVSDDLHSYDQMDGFSIYPWNYDTIDGDYFACYPAVDECGHFYLDGDDSNQQTMDVQIIRNAFRKARQARFEHGATPIASNSPLNSKAYQKKKLEEADIDNDTLMQALSLQRQKQKPEIGRLFNWEDAL